MKIYIRGNKGTENTRDIFNEYLKKYNTYHDGLYLQLNKSRTCYKITEGRGLGITVNYGYLNDAYQTFANLVNEEDPNNYESLDDFYSSCVSESLADGRFVNYPTQGDIQKLDFEYKFSDQDLDNILTRIDELIQFIVQTYNESFDANITVKENARSIFESGYFITFVNKRKVKLWCYGCGFILYILGLGYSSDQVKPSRISRFFSDNYIEDIRQILGTDDVIISKLGNITFTV